MHCIFIDLVFYCHAFYTWASGSDDRGNPIPRIDVNKLKLNDWLIETAIKTKFVNRFFKKSFSTLVDQCTIKSPNFVSI